LSFSPSSPFDRPVAIVYCPLLAVADLQSTECARSVGNHKNSQRSACHRADCCVRQWN
jgi:hypothetical protein